MDSCGPSNGVKNLVQYSQRDTSIQNDVVRNQQPQTGPNQFRSNPAVDNNLNRQFNQFNNGNQFATQFMNQFNNGSIGQQRNSHMAQNMRQQPGPQHQFEPQMQHHSQNHANWVNDFSGLSLEQKNQQHQQNQWGQQFNQVITQVPEQVHNVAQRSHGMVMPSYTGFQMNTRSHLNTNYQPNPANMTEHQEVHKVEMESQQFEQQFQELENEMATDRNQDRERFAETARKIHHSLSNDVKSEEMNDKLKESSFMKLMSSISSGKVELNESGDKLVDNQGQDVREVDYHDAKHEDIPQTNTAQQSSHSSREETPIGHDFQTHRQYISPPVPHPVSSSQPQEHEEPQPQQSQLPDPLAHIPDGALDGITDPLQAARIISGNQVQGGNWMEDYDMEPTRPAARGRLSGSAMSLNAMREQEYDDYRHDDDYR